MTLREQRLKAGLSQQQLADKSGVTVKNIQHYEGGYRDLDNAKLATIAKLSHALDCRIPDILSNEELKKLYNKVR